MIKHWIIVTFAALLSAASPAMAGSVSSATGTTLCTSYSSMAVDPAGNVSITGCNLGSTNATFTVVAAAATATTGTPLAVTVTRTLSTSGTHGTDTLTLIVTPSTAGTFTTATLSFTAADGATSSKSSSITFSAVGTATLSATGVATVTASSPITVIQGSTACAGITPYPSKNNRTVPELVSSGGYAFGGVKLTEMINNYGVGALAFQIPSDTPRSGYWVFQYLDYTGGAQAPVYSAISECSGDMRGAGANSINDSAMDKLCRTDPANAFVGTAFSNDANTIYCKLTPGKTYYYNIRARDVQVQPGMNYVVSTQ